MIAPFSKKTPPKTLKQLLRNKQIYNFNGTPQTANFMEKEIQTAVKEWLTQKLKMQPTTNSVEHSNERQRIKTIRNLLEDLK